MSKEKELHSKLQASIDRMQSNNDELAVLLQALCLRLGNLIGYKHKKKECYRVYVSIKEKEYDVYDLIEQTERYIEEKKKGGGE